MIIPFPVTTVIAQAGPGLPPPAPALPTTGAKPADPTLVAKHAEGLLHQLQTGKLDRTTLDTKMNAALTDDKLSTIKSDLGPLGDPVSFTPEGTQNQNGLTVYTYKVDFQQGTLNETYAVDSDGKVAGVWFAPPDADGSPTNGGGAPPASSGAPPSSSGGTPP
jgi:hypothetical protein